MKNDLELQTKVLGEALRETREYLGLSLRELARASGVSHTQIMRIESGEFDFFTVSFVRLCGAMGIKFSELLERCITPDTDIYRKAIEAELKTHFPEQFHTGEDSRNALKDLVFGGCNIMVYLLRSSTPIELASEFDYPTEAVKNRFLGIAERIRGQKLDLKTRVTLIGLMQTSPVATMRKYFSFPTPDEVAAHIDLADTPAKNRFYPWLQFLQPQSMKALQDLEMKWLEEDYLDQKTGVDIVHASVNSDDVKAQWPLLKKRLQKAAKPPGLKSKLAEFLGVKLASVSQWLSDSESQREPGAETTLLMLKWVELQERQSK